MKWTARINVEYGIDVTIEADSEDDAQQEFGRMCEENDFLPTQLEPQEEPRLEHDGNVVCENPGFAEKMD